MKTLYVSDLDGTLFNSKKQLTHKSISILNNCIDNGMNFTIATARMPYGCDYRLEDLKLQLPGITANGVFLYDFVKKEYRVMEEVSRRDVIQVLDTFRRRDVSCFVYTLSKGQLSIYFEQEEMKMQTQYYSERALANCREVQMVADAAEKAMGQSVVYMTYTGSWQKTSVLAEELKKIEGIAVSHYLNVYNGEYCIEIFHRHVSKRETLLCMKKELGFDEIVVFGDNYNDLPMFEVADRKYAPMNAVPDIKERADEVIAGCDEDGVALFLEREWAKQK